MLRPTEQSALRTIFETGGGSISVTTDDPTVAAIVRGLFPEYRVTTSGHGAITSYGVTGSPDNTWIVEGLEQGQLRSFGSLEAAIADLEFALTTDILGSFPDHLHLHASGAVKGNSAILATGPSGSGKSSIGLWWSVNGYPVTGDDIALIDERCRVTPFKRLFKVQAGVLESANLDPSDSLCWKVGDSEAWFDPLTAGGWSDTAAVSVVAAVHFSPGANLSVKPLSKSSALKVLLAGVMESGRSREESFDTLLQLAQTVQCVEVHFGDAREAAVAIVALA